MGNGCLSLKHVISHITCTFAVLSLCRLFSYMVLTTVSLNKVNEHIRITKKSKALSFKGVLCSFWEEIYTITKVMIQTP